MCHFFLQNCRGRKSLAFLCGLDLIGGRAFLGLRQNLVELLDEVVDVVPRHADGGSGGQIGKVQLSRVGTPTCRHTKCIVSK